MEESEKRYKAYKQGKVKGIPLEVIQKRYSK
ncbi:MAG: addiction module protein [Candidatus Hodarchaeota archaeon]